MSDQPDPLAQLAVALRRTRQSTVAAIEIAISSEPGRTLQRYARAWDEVGPEIVEELARASQEWLSHLDAAVPPNWRELTHPQMFAAIDLMHGVGCSLVGTPPAPVIEELLDAPTGDDRRAILLRAASTITSDVDEALCRLAGTEHHECANAAREALAAWRSGHHRASQALTTAALTTTLHEHMQQRSHTKIRAEFLQAQMDQGELSDFRWIAVQGAVARVLDPYDPLLAPPRSDYRRNASAHRVAHPQYRPANALSAIMLLTSLMVELHERAERLRV